MTGAAGATGAARDGAGAPSPDHSRTRAGRRELALVIRGCALGAGVVLLAAGRDWLVEETVRPAPLPPLQTTRTGTDLRPFLPALGWLALAGAGALLAVRGLLRRLLGLLLIAVGVVIVVAVAGVIGGTTTGLWPVAAIAGGGVVAAAGLAAVVWSGRWPALGARYARSPGGRPADRDRGSPESWWEALDRGEDPTDEPPRSDTDPR